MPWKLEGKALSDVSELRELVAQEVRNLSPDNVDQLELTARAIEVLMSNGAITGPFNIIMAGQKDAEKNKDVVSLVISTTY